MILHAVGNGYIDLCQVYDFFDLTYADLSQLKPNFVFSLHLNAFKNGCVERKFVNFLG